MKKILVAETDSVTRMILEKFLADYDFEIIFADFTGEAMNQMFVHKPDLFISSDVSDVFDGESLYKAIRDMDTGADIPFIMLYNSDKTQPDKEDDPKFVAIQKPFSIIKLIGIIRGLLNGKFTAIFEEDEKKAEEEERAAFQKLDTLSLLKKYESAPPLKSPESLFDNISKDTANSTLKETLSATPASIFEDVQPTNQPQSQAEDLFGNMPAASDSIFGNLETNKSEEDSNIFLEAVQSMGWDTDPTPSELF